MAARTGRMTVIGLAAALAWLAPSALVSAQTGTQTKPPPPPTGTQTKPTPPQTGTQTKPTPPQTKPTPPQTGGATTPQTQPTTGSGSKPAGTSTPQALGTVRVPRQAVANGEPLAPGTYSVRLVSGPVPGAVGQTPEESKWVEFVQGTTVKGKEMATVMTADEVKKIAEGSVPAAGTSKVQVLKGEEYLRVWINRANTHYLVNLALGK